MNNFNKLMALSALMLSSGSVTLFYLTANSLAQAPQTVSASDDKRFVNQNFSQQALRQIPQGISACKQYQKKELCAYKRKHIFRNATLTFEQDITTYVQATMTPTNPISLEQALSYARILGGRNSFLGDRDSYVNFASPSSRSKKQIVYSGCEFKVENENKNIFLCISQLSLTLNGKIKKIFLHFESP
ncbi:hypothetical protein LC593_09505 [Nostoc sp. CHAB 5844]|nr:hypothetical protein [Nostoc sp. CHAB 5844]